MAVYTCTNDKCQFCFERKGKIDACPDCGKMGIRLATKEESAEYKRNKSELNKEQAINC